MVNLGYVLLFFVGIIIKTNRFVFRYCNNSLLYTFPAFAPYRFDVIPSKACNLLSSLLLNSVALTSSVKTLQILLLNYCCNFNMILLFCESFLVVFKLKSSFYYTLFCYFSYFITVTVIYSVRIYFWCKFYIFGQ